MADKDKEQSKTEGVAEPVTVEGEDTKAPVVDEVGIDEVAADADEEFEEMDLDAGEVQRTSEFAVAPRIGILTVHFPERDVEFVVDGTAALRIMAIYAHGIDRGDRIDPRTSPQHAAWLALDIEKALALTWWPRLPAPASKRRIAIDPPVPAAAA